MRRRGHNLPVYRRAPKGLDTPAPRKGKPRAIVCPQCGAEVGKACLNEQGAERAATHISRQRMATRAANAARMEATG